MSVNTIRKDTTRSANKKIRRREGKFKTRMQMKRYQKREKRKSKQGKKRERQTLERGEASCEEKFPIRVRMLTKIGPPPIPAPAASMPPTEHSYDENSQTYRNMNSIRNKSCIDCKPYSSVERKKKNTHTKRTRISETVIGSRFLCPHVPSDRHTHRDSRSEH